MMTPLRIALRASTLLWHAARVPRPSDDRRTNAVRLRQTTARLAEAHGIRLEVVGRCPEGSFIGVSNHLSYLDPIVLAPLFDCAPIAKSEVFGWPLIGAALKGLGGIEVRRGSARSGATALRSARRSLEAGVSVLAFPEGTTSRGERVLPFRRGLFGLAARLGVPVVPIGLQFFDPKVPWVEDRTFASHYLEIAATHAILARAAIGAPLRALPDERPAAFAERTRLQVAALAGCATVKHLRVAELAESSQRQTAA
jgi:1-acyl-sn-glycerol-3-phosphate acyltransferase